jgi:hypothetical protein
MGPQLFSAYRQHSLRSATEYIEVNRRNADPCLATRGEHPVKCMPLIRDRCRSGDAVIACRQFSFTSI